MLLGATPKAVQTAMDLDGLTLFHVKSHLQKFRMGKVTVKELKEIPKIPSRRFGGPKISTSRSNRPVRANGHAKFKGSKAEKTTEAKQGERGQLYQKLQEARNKYIDGELENAYKEFVNQYISGADGGVPSIFRNDLAGVGTKATTPSLNSNQKNTYPQYNTLERIEECLSLQKQASSSRGYQLQNQNVAHSETRSNMTSDGYSFPAYNSTNANNVQVNLKEQTPSFLPQDVASATASLMASIGFSFPAYNPINAIDVNVGLKDQPQSFLPQNAGYHNQPQSAARGYQSQNAAYGYQPQNAADFSTNDFPNSNRNYLGIAANSVANIFPTNGNYSGSATYFAGNNFPLSNGNYSGCAVYSATNNLPTLNGNYSGTSAHPVISDLTNPSGNYFGSAIFSAANNFPTSSGTYSGSANYSAENNFLTSKGNHSGSTSYSAAHNFPTSIEQYSGAATYSAANNFPTSNMNYSGRTAQPVINDLETSEGNYSGTAYHSVINDLTTSKGNYSGNAAYPVINSLTSSEGNYSGSVAYPVANDFTTNGNYSGTPTYPVLDNFTTSKGNHCGCAASAYSAVNDLTTSNENYSGNTAYSGTNNLPTSNGKKYSGTEYLEDLSAALAASGNNSESLLGTLEEDPIDAYMNWDNAEPNTKDDGLGFTNPYAQNN
ncbi:hypothetical protein Pint_01779 [Pistacia integerrima]|uniref:Uncharacterized protein n=1 Tax=Pistacia integerrima TaxID=434235 RepID=A0ACC0ZGH2_9ROSI|nr:hypothetical protein Pint_01779 [Pistacia integerrima]